VWFGFDCLRTGTGGGLLWVRWWTFGFLRHIVICILGIFRFAWYETRRAFTLQFVWTSLAYGRKSMNLLLLILDVWYAHDF
jgi:hypothetical protein